MTIDSIVTPGQEHVETMFAEQVLMMSLAQGKYFALEGTARRVWELISQQHPIALREVVRLLVDEFDATPQQCEADVLAFAERLQANGLIAVVGP